MYNYSQLLFDPSENIRKTYTENDIRDIKCRKIINIKMNYNYIN